ncbi:MAG TPA: hypothetical protein VJ021_03620 [Thermoplasmata archaeon]|nr:hypothetical protein [Thermoplasmata archaeon]
MTVWAFPVGQAMQTKSVSKGRVSSAKSGIVLAVVAGMVLAMMFLVAPARASPVAQLTPTNGNTQQWAFGGSASGHFSCSNQSCTGNVTVNGTVSLSYQYYIEWVVIYTVTNVSSKQTMIEVQTALNASASFSLSECINNGTAPCQPLSASLNLAGQETAAGFTNVTSGTVNLTASLSSPLGTTAAQAIQNAASTESFNFSGSESYSGVAGGGGLGQSGAVSFDFGAHETSSVTFTTPLGVVPLNPQPGDSWTASAPFSATGSWTSGYTFSSSGTLYHESNWTSGTVSPSGIETVNGTDLGQFTLYDNYTNPPTTIIAQEILLDFGNGVFDGADGWLIVPSTLYGGVYGGLLGTGLATPEPGLSPAISLQPSAGNTTLTSGESAFYQHGVGFIGAAASGSAATGGATGPTINLKAGPEPVSVAQQQYGAITSSSSGGSSSSGFPWIYVVVAVVVVVVAVLAAVMVLRRRQRHPPAAMAAAAGSPTMGGPTPGGGPQAPTPPSQTAGATPPAAPVCPACGQPGIYIAQYGRFYCYSDKQYL